MKRFGQIITTTILILSLCLSLSACVFDNSITPEQTLKDEVLSLFSNVKFEKVEEEPGTEKGELTKTFNLLNYIKENLLKSNNKFNIQNTLDDGQFEYITSLIVKRYNSVIKNKAWIS